MGKEIHLIGYGINFCEQRTISAEDHLRKVDAIFAIEPDISHIREYLTVDKPIYNLFHLYKAGLRRIDVYNQISNNIIQSLEYTPKIALLVDGCPFF